MTGPESCTAHQISRSELLICVYRSVLRPALPDPQEGLSSGSGAKNSYLMYRIFHSMICKFNLYNYRFVDTISPRSARK
eukprot:COSAG02_NODE_4886_length_4863_cov_9.058144_2_plen_79_part_00